MTESLHVNLSFSGPVVLVKNIFRIFSYIHTYKIVFSIVASSDPLGQ
jgi:hypothetical protein